LRIDVGSVLDQNSNNDILSCQRCNVKRRIAFPCRRIDVRSAFDQLSHYLIVAFFACKVQSIQAVRITGIDVDSVVKKLQYLVEVASTCGSQERGILVGSALKHGD
jgi:hypothetical protein